jgi:hypothetical protein
MSADEYAITKQPTEIAVCCLACGARYRKPPAGTVTRANPGCPACGYLGWALDADLPPRRVLPVDERRLAT